MEGFDLFSDEIQEFEKLKKAWYNSEPVLFEIVKTLKDRECVFLNTITNKNTQRCIKANAVKFLTRNFMRFGFLENTYNLYSSLSHLPNMPMFSFSFKEKATQQRIFNDEFMIYVKGYDFLLDIDCENVEEAYKEAVKIKKIFDNNKVIYHLKFSGKKGFHFIVEYQDFPQWIKDLDFKEMESLFKSFAERFAIYNNFTTIDTRIFDLRRICKTPYSVVYPYYFVALPLSDEQFDSFNFEMVSLPNLIQDVDKMRNRGLLKRQGDIEGFGNLVKRHTKEYE